MSCCGKKRRTPINKLPEADRELVLVEYIGTKPATKTYYGARTFQRYRFGLKRIEGYVYKADLITSDRRKPGILQMTRKGKILFRKKDEQ